MGHPAPISPLSDIVKRFLVGVSPAVRPPPPTRPGATHLTLCSCNTPSPSLSCAEFPCGPDHPSSLSGWRQRPRPRGTRMLL